MDEDSGRTMEAQSGRLPGEAGETSETTTGGGGATPNNGNQASGAPSGSAETQDSNEWAEIARRIQQLIRRDTARLVGAGESADWGGIKDALVGRVRGQAAEIDRTEIGRRIEELGKEVEERLRVGLAQATGAGPGADWEQIGRSVRERVEQAIDSANLPRPGGAGAAGAGDGGSGTGASAEDASVPAASPSPDAPPRPAGAGGEDTGLPTVTQNVDEPPRTPPTASHGSGGTTKPGGTS
jgi:hypothetical protein